MAIGGSKMRTMAAMQQPNRQGGAMPMPEVAPAVKGRSAMTGGRAFGNRPAFGVAQQRPVAPAVPAPAPTAPANMRPRKAAAPADMSAMPAPRELTAQQRASMIDAFNAQQKGAMQQFNQSPNLALYTQSQPRTAPKTLAPTGASMGVPNMDKTFTLAKGGAVKKKPGYAKGGAVVQTANCGASMKPQQKAKK